MKEQEEINKLVESLGGTIDSAEKLGVSRQKIWELTSGKIRGTQKVYLYALRYLRLLPVLRRTKGFKEYMDERGN